MSTHETPDPGPPLATPEDVLRASSLTRGEKIARLREMAYDARELDVASGEGMVGPGSDLQRILQALRQLGASGEAGAAMQ